ncbi:hypothetical protein BGX31_001534 [Mortierella sp. GBA43]|nr:hypothetical protein BGX31_001534 [Mortierella sp. GBA43]
MASSVDEASGSEDAVVNKQSIIKSIDFTKTFFHTKGIDTFVDLITDAGTYGLLTGGRPRFGQKKLVDSYDDIANYINSKHGTNWSRTTVYNTLKFVKSRYCHAKKILASGEGGNTEADTTLRDEALTVCPPFERLQTVIDVDSDGQPAEDGISSETAVATSSKGGVANKQVIKGIDFTKTFFHTEGIDTFVDLITDAGTYGLLTGGRPRFGQKKLVDSYDDIANYINSKHGTKWDRTTVYNTLRFVQSRYCHAKNILASGEGGNTEADTTLRDEALTVCPPFERLQTVIDVDSDGQPAEDGISSKTAVATSSKGGVVNKQAIKGTGVPKNFFHTEGIDTFVDLITGAGNYEPSTSTRSTYSQKNLVHTYSDIAKYINSKHGTRWNRNTAYNTLRFVQSRYCQAKKILASGEGRNTEADSTLRDKILTVCPPFEKLHTVFETPVAGLHLPPVQTLTSQPGEPSSSKTLLSRDMVDQDGIDDMDYDDQPTEDETTLYLSRGSKRRKTEKIGASTLQDQITQTMQASDRQHIPMDDATGDLRRRQEVLEAREKDLTDRLLETERKHHEMLMKREEQHREMLVRMEEQHWERLMKKESDHKESLKEREKDHRKALKKRERDHRGSLKKREEEYTEYQQKQWERRLGELEDEKAELKEEKARFRKERDGVLQDTAAKEAGGRTQNYTM